MAGRLGEIVVEVALAGELGDTVGGDRVLRVWSSVAGNPCCSPYTAPPVEAKTTLLTPYSRQFWRRRIVPNTFTSASKSGSRTERLTSIWAAWWQSTSGPKSSKISAHPERISAS